MRTRFLASLGTLFTSTALAFSQVPAGYYPAYPAAPGYGYYPSYGAAPGYGTYYYPGQVCPPGYGYDRVLPPAPAQPPAVQPKSTPPAPLPSDKQAQPAPKTPQQKPAPTTPSQNQTPSTVSADMESAGVAPDGANMGPDASQVAEGGQAFATGLSSVGDIATPVGVGLTSAATVQTGGPGGPASGGPATGATAVKSAPAPLLLPGLFTAFNVESAIPQTRLFFGYGGYHGFETINTNTGIAGKAFNLNVFTVGAELAIPDNGMSIYVRVPTLEATNNTTGVRINGIGDVSAGFKFLLFEVDETGSALTIGATVATPTGNDLKVPVNRYAFDFDPTGTVRTSPAGQTLPPNQTVSLNPTYIQPWVAGQWVRDRLFVSAYGAVCIPTDDAFSTFVNGEFGIGWQVYRACCQDEVLTSITPSISLQALIPLDHHGTPLGNAAYTGSVSAAPNGQLIDNNPQGNIAINSPYQLYLTGGATFVMGCRSVITVGVVTPVMGPKAYSVGGVAGFNLLF
jgi:hypothetical protein